MSDQQQTMFQQLMEIPYDEVMPEEMTLKLRSTRRQLASARDDAIKTMLEKQGKITTLRRRVKKFDYPVNEIIALQEEINFLRRLITYVEYEWQFLFGSEMPEGI